MIAVVLEKSVRQIEYLTTKGHDTEEVEGQEPPDLLHDISIDICADDPLSVRLQDEDVIRRAPSRIRAELWAGYGSSSVLPWKTVTSDPSARKAERHSGAIARAQSGP